MFRLINKYLAAFASNRFQFYNILTIAGLFYHLKTGVFRQSSRHSDAIGRLVVLEQ